MSSKNRFSLKRTPPRTAKAIRGGSKERTTSRLSLAGDLHRREARALVELVAAGHHAHDALGPLAAGEVDDLGAIVRRVGVLPPLAERHEGGGVLEVGVVGGDGYQVVRPTGREPPLGQPPGIHLRQRFGFAHGLAEVEEVDATADDPETRRREALGVDLEVRLVQPRPGDEHLDGRVGVHVQVDEVRDHHPRLGVHPVGDVVPTVHQGVGEGAHQSAPTGLAQLEQVVISTAGGAHFAHHGSGKTGQHLGQVRGTNRRGGASHENTSMGKPSLYEKLKKVKPKSSKKNEN